MAPIHVEPVTSVEDLIAVPWRAKERIGQPQWYRGQASSGWHLLPGIWRPPFDRPNTEKHLIHVFMAMGRTRSSSCPASTSVCEWLPFAQHHRLPTRLLDWTASPLTAAYFAVAREYQNEASEGKPAAIWALNWARLNRNQVGRRGLAGLGTEEARAVFAAALADDNPAEKTNKTLALLVEQTNLRMLTQQAGMTIHGTKVPLDQLGGAEDFVMKFEICAGQKDWFHTSLAVVGVRRSVLFPDLDSCAAELRDMIERGVLLDPEGEEPEPGYGGGREQSEQGS